MKKKQLIIVCMLLGLFFLNGCSEKRDLTGMSDRAIKNYFDRCVAHGKIFFYAGGFGDTPLVDEKYHNFVKQFKQVYLGCIGGVLEGRKFNKLMLDYVEAGYSYKPKYGYVADEETAVKIAEAILTPIYGKEAIEEEKPFTAKLKEGVWIVSGTLNADKGGVAEVEISKNNGVILRVSHGK